MLRWLTKKNKSIFRDPIIEELEREVSRVEQEMNLYAEGRGEENLPWDESCKITNDLLEKSSKSRWERK